MIYLSVCIPTYNRVEALKRQVEFFLPFVDKHRDDVEIIVSNNCSTDCTADYLEAKTNIPGLIINTNKENVGLIGNLRVVTEMAQGQYIWVVGDDDEVFEETLEKVLEIVKTEPLKGHVFLNYCIKEGKKSSYLPVYKGKNGLFEDGFEMFSSITEESTLGANLFLTANIFNGERLKKANKVVDDCGEIENLSLPLAWSLFCSNMPGFIENKVCLGDQIEGISWSASRNRVFYRDHFAICDKLANQMGIAEKMNKLMICNMPSTYPAVKFALLNKNKNLDNYAAKWLWSNYKMKYIRDILFFPFYTVKIVIRIIRRKISNK